MDSLVLVLMIVGGGLMVFCLGRKEKDQNSSSLGYLLLSGFAIFLSGFLLICHTPLWIVGMINGLLVAVIVAFWVYSFFGNVLDWIRDMIPIDRIVEK